MALLENAFIVLTMSQKPKGAITWFAFLLSAKVKGLSVTSVRETGQITEIASQFKTSKMFDH